MRKLATIKKIDSIQPINGADAIELAIIGGWQVVIRKGEFKEGSTIVFCEIDSWIPTALAPFLTKPGREPREYNGIQGERLRTIKLRGQISQGLVLPLDVLGQCGISYAEIDEDVTDRLGIQKWEKELSANIRGLARSNFPSLVPKTDEERIQNLKKKLSKWVEEGKQWEVTEKLDGSSMTVYLDLDWDLHVCSRNIDLKPDSTNAFWQVADLYHIGQRMIDSGLIGYAIQGELVGPGIQGNKYKLKGLDFYVYKVYSVKECRYLTPPERIALMDYLGLKHVPILFESLVVPDSIPDILSFADGKSVLYDTDREGLVFKDTVSDISWKAISNVFLMKGGE
jgi:RNA ligase (TIGR02306 family)